MKNLHLIGTDKPSRLLKSAFCLELLPTASNGWKKPNQNIYITNDETIKTGDWYIADNKLYGASVDHMPELYTYPCKKIILTTDQDLIKDGVQAIDDEFLEWFVKNHTCQFVEVNKMCYGALSKFADAGYKIIIPKEEPKHIPYKGKVWEPPKQETLEEASKRAVKSGLFKDETLFIAGAKWQQENNKKMYSEEDLRNCFTPSYQDFGEWFEQFKNKSL
jgi:hypothetical protein